MKKKFIKKIGMLLFSITIFFTSLVFAYDTDTERRINIGLRLFRTLLASDTLLPQKIDTNHQLNLLFISAKEISRAQRYSNKLMNIGRGDKKGKIHNFPIHISAITISQLPKFQSLQIAGIYIVDKLSSQQLETITKYGISHSLIVYSPFDGDVQQGILAGIAIGIRVQPFINQKTLEQSQLILNPLFLKVSKTYED